MAQRGTVARSTAFVKGSADFKLDQKNGELLRKEADDIYKQIEEVQQRFMDKAME
jgi:hypothetical protein